jgi:hypothetical protein
MANRKNRRGLASEDSPFTGGANLFVDGGVSAMDLS